MINRRPAEPSATRATGRVRTELWPEDQPGRWGTVLSPAALRSAGVRGGPLRAVALDYGGTISIDTFDRVLEQKPVDPDAASALHTLHARGLRLILASNTMPCETRWPALQAAGVADLFTAALLSYPLGVAKPEPTFYRLVCAAAGCPADQVLFVGDHIKADVAVPIDIGMRAALVRPTGLRPGEALPDGAALIHHVRELPALLASS